MNLGLEQAPPVKITIPREEKGIRRSQSFRAASEAGFSILEVAFAIAILVIVLVPVSSVLGTIFKVGANSRFEQEATEIASSTLDNEVAAGAATLLGETGTRSLPSVSSSGQTYLLEMEVAPYDPGSSICVSPASDPGAMLKVTIWATWANEATGSTWWVAGTSGATTLTVEVASLVAVPTSVINPTLGSILVSIEGATGEAVGNVSVTATPSSGRTDRHDDFGWMRALLQYHGDVGRHSDVDGLIRIAAGVPHGAGTVDPAHPIKPFRHGRHHHVRAPRADRQSLRRLRRGGHRGSHIHRTGD